MKIRFLALIALLLAGASARADDATTAAAATPVSTASPAATPVPNTWKKQIITNLTLNQASFSNWAQGGTDMISWQAGLDAHLENDNQAVNWANGLKLQYGLTYLANQGTQISSDTIDLESLFTLKVWKDLNPYLSLSAQSQFGPGYDYSSSPSVEVSNFLDPGYFTESAGVKYAPASIFYTRAGLGLKETVASQFEDTYTKNLATGTVSGELTQLGLDWVSELNVNLFSNSNFDSKLDTFWPGGSLDLTVAEWDNLLSFKLNKIISLNMEDDFRYDTRVYNGIQIKETLGLGFAYSLL
jgi:hypothetical protein